MFAVMFKDHKNGHRHIYKNQFIKNLNDADAEFPLTLIEKLFSIIKKMLPKTKNIQTEETIRQQE